MRTKILPVLLPAYWLCGVLVTVLAGFRPNPASRHDPELFVYAFDTVFYVVGFMTVHTLLLMAILRPATFNHSWGRALAAFVPTFAFLVLAAMGSMHAPPAWGFYMLWVLALSVALFALIFTAAARPRQPDGGRVP